MDLCKNLHCPQCHGEEFEVKRKVTYIYSYRINNDNKNESLDKTDELPFLFDNREKQSLRNIYYVKAVRVNFQLI